jgi:hypothetical protein
MKKIPRAPFAKRARYTLYLVQPALQFAALILVMVFLSRCSPLAPSTDTLSPVKGAHSENVGANGNVEGTLREDLIINSLMEVSSDPVIAIPEADFSELTQGALQSDQAASEAQVQRLLDLRSKKLRFAGAGQNLGPLVNIRFSSEQLQSLWREGKVRIDLADHLSGFDAKSRQLLFREFQAPTKKIGAKSYFVLDDDAAQNAELRNLQLPLKISLGVISEDKAYLEISRDEQIALPLSAINPFRKLAVVLE